MVHIHPLNQPRKQYLQNSFIYYKPLHRTHLQEIEVFPKTQKNLLVDEGSQNYLSQAILKMFFLQTQKHITYKHTSYTNTHHIQTHITYKHTHHIQTYTSHTTNTLHIHTNKLNKEYTQCFVAQVCKESEDVQQQWFSFFFLSFLFLFLFLFLFFEVQPNKQQTTNNKQQITNNK